MKHIKQIFFTAAPFVIFSVFNSVSAPFWKDDREILLFALLGSIAIMAVIMLVQFKLKDTHYFPATILFFFITWLAIVLYTPAKGYEEFLKNSPFLTLVLKNPQIGLYSSLFLMAALLPLVKIPPFTVYFAQAMIPEEYHGSTLYKYVNLVISYFWALLFMICIAMQFLEGILMQTILPLVLQLGIGLPVTRFLIPFLQSRLAFVEQKGKRLYLTTAYDAVKGMPFIYNRKAARDINAVFQFHISGNENFDGYITLKDGSCFYNDGIPETADLTILSDADVWLQISRGEMTGAEAFLKKMYSVEGDLAQLISMQKIFEGNSGNIESIQYADDTTINKTYESVKPGTIKKILVLQGSPRKKGVSKTDSVTELFIEGCRDAGAQTETVYLHEKKINPCTGCFTCWSKTPGICIFKDDMQDIMQKEIEADLVVYAFPLYHFGINSLLKKYIERTLPMVEPYQIMGKNGLTCHPVREKFRKKRYAVIIGVCGFPEVSHFKAASENFHAIAQRGADDGLSIVAEIYRPASETFNIPFYAEEKKRVSVLLKKAGKELIEKGFIEKEIITEIGRVNIPIEQVHQEANMTWDLCIKEGKTLPDIQAEFLQDKFRK